MRPSFENYFLEIAKLVSTRATCGRAHHGAVAVQDRRIIATAYNGSPSKMGHCDDVGCLIVGGHCIRTAHCEENLINQAVKYNIDLRGAVVYITGTPCPVCLRLLLKYGIKEIVAAQPYRVDDYNKEDPYRQELLDVWGATLRYVMEDK